MAGCLESLFHACALPTSFLGKTLFFSVMQVSLSSAGNLFKNGPIPWNNQREAPSVIYYRNPSLLYHFSRHGSPISPPHQCSMVSKPASWWRDGDWITHDCGFVMAEQIILVIRLENLMPSHFYAQRQITIKLMQVRFEQWSVAMQPVHLKIIS